LTRISLQCLPGPDGPNPCNLCTKLQTACHVPEFDDRKRTHTRKLIDSLKAENEKLRAQLAEHRKVCLLNSDHDDSTGTPESDTSVLEEVSPGTESNSSKSDNMIVRLCGGQRQLNSDRVGRLRFFGPTSSLHLMESVTSSILIGRDTSSGSTKPVWQDDFPLEMQNYLLDLYWTYLHQVLPWYGPFLTLFEHNTWMLTNTFSHDSAFTKKPSCAIWQAATPDTVARY
jgi:hypothetical protein